MRILSEDNPENIVLFDDLISSFSQENDNKATVNKHKIFFIIFKI
jgi:hypothetical protein